MLRDAMLSTGVFSLLPGQRVLQWPYLALTMPSCLMELWPAGHCGHYLLFHVQLGFKRPYRG